MRREEEDQASHQLSAAQHRPDLLQLRQVVFACFPEVVQCRPPLLRLQSPCEPGGRKFGLRKWRSYEFEAHPTGLPLSTVFLRLLMLLKTQNIWHLLLLVKGRPLYLKILSDCILVLHHSPLPMALLLHRIPLYPPQEDIPEDTQSIAIEDIEALKKLGFFIDQNHKLGQGVCGVVFKGVYGPNVIQNYHFFKLFENNSFNSFLGPLYKR